MKIIDNAHADHRGRLRRQFLDGGVDSCPEHQILEFFLFTYIPRKDTNEIAHELIRRFGSLHAVFDAPLQELKKVKGMTETACANIVLYHRISNRIAFDKAKKRDCLDSVDAVYKYVEAFTRNLNEEHCYLICLDGAYRVIRRELMQKGIVNKTVIYLRQVAEAAILCRAIHILIVHNHPSGNLWPSSEDMDVTREMFRVFPPLEINLLDHLIVGPVGGYYSFRDSEEFWRLREGVKGLYTPELNDAFYAWDKKPKASPI